MTGRVLALGVRLFTGVKRIPSSVLPSSPVLYFAPHQSHFDFLTIWAALPADRRAKLRPVAAKDYWTGGPVRRWLSKRVFNSILLDRKARREGGAHPLDPIIETLEGGESVLLFPEGTRRTDDEPGKFLPGIYHIAKAIPELRLVPVRLENLSRIMPKGEVLPLPLIARIELGEPTCLESAEAKDQFLERLRLMVMPGEGNGKSD